MDFFDEREFVLIDAPIFTPNACEGTTTLFQTQYFEETAYLTQSGQLYGEAAAASFGKVYCFGPTFRAEQSKTRRHLMEFWMVEPEMAFAELPDAMDLAEAFVATVVGRVLENCRSELQVLERDVSKLEAIVPPFPRLTYDEAILRLQRLGSSIQEGDDFGADDETTLSNQFEKTRSGASVSRENQGFFICNPTPTIQTGRCVWTCWLRKATAKSSAVGNAFMITGR